MSFFADHPIVIVLVPLAFAAVCPLLGFVRRQLCFWWALIGCAATAFVTWSLVGTVTSRLALTYNIGDWTPPWGIRIRVDVPALLLGCAITAAVLLLFVASYRASEEGGEQATPRPYSCTLVLLGAAGMLGVLVSDDIFNMLVFLVIGGVAMAGLVAASGRVDALRAAFRYLIAMAASASLFMMAIALLYSVTGTLDMRRMSLQIEIMKEGYIPVAIVALVLFVTALAVEAALFPASWWLPDATAVAHESAGGALAALMVGVACFAMLRVLYTVYSPALTRLETARTATTTTLAWVGVIAFVAGASIAACQVDIKRTAAYSAVSQVGLVVAGISATAPKAVAGGLFSVVSGVCGISCLVLASGALARTQGTARILRLRGAGRRNPIAAAAFTLGALTFVGVPFTVGWTAKRLLAEGLLDKGWYVPVALVTLGSAIALLYYGRVIYLLFSRDDSSATAEMGVKDATLSVPALALGVAGVAIGILAFTLTPTILEAARRLLT